MTQHDPRVPHVPLSMGMSSPIALTPEPTEPPPAPAQEPFGLLDLEEPPETYGIDDVMVLARDPFTLFVYWEITAEGRAAGLAALGQDAALALRLVISTPMGDEVQDHALDWDHGRRYLGAPRPGSVVQALLGLRAPDGRFHPVAAGARVRVPWREPGPDGPVEWMEVVPASGRGEREPVRVVQRGPARAIRGAPGAAQTRFADGAGPLAEGGAGPSPSSPTSPKGGGPR